MFAFAAQNLLSRPVRSLLALLGLTVAIAGMVGLFSIASGIDDTVNRTFSRVPGLAAMQPGAPIPLFSRLPITWADEIAQVKGVRLVRPEVWARAQLVDGKPTFSPPRLLFGTDIDATLKLKTAVFRDDMIKGRFLTADDKGTFNCVLSESIAESLHKTVGDTVRIDGYDTTIVGIYRCGSLLLDVAIIMDRESVRTVAKFDPGLVTSIYFELDGTVPKEQLMDDVRRLFRGRRSEDWQDAAIESMMGKSSSRLKNVAAKLIKNRMEAEEESPEGGTSDPSQEDAVEVRSAEDWGDKVQELSADLDIFLWLMTGIGVVIALLSILNTMLMSVAERMIEFGVLRANGWSAWDVLKLITCESALLGVFGGMLGCLAGWITVQIVNMIFPTKIHLFASPSLLLFSLAFSTMLGTLGGLYPAYWAVRMSPMEAIRRG